MFKLKEKLTIGEMAKLRGMTAETLRHYDRIDLFKPQYIDPNSGYRFYSIYQYEVLGTIKELRQLGMSTDEIKDYFNERNFSKSLDILKAKHADLVSKLNELTDLEENIREKIVYLDLVAREKELQTVMFREIGRRKLITLNEKINNNLELCYGVIRLENMLAEKTPILASNRLGILIQEADLRTKRFEEPSVIFVVAKSKEKIPKQYQRIVPAGLFACIRYNGELLWNRSESLCKIFDYLDEGGYQITGDALQIMHVDITITDKPNEITFEIQVPVQKV
ncbi:MerR family transcriptional regulator [Peribacillus frigoritolerans]|uniref:MerR family transcriptional regulator n=1 Tax=Peribacillus frigoritolerans TaxID=450367 RepID=UPI00207AE8EC|nr:MerR family transcriptional regulator [Peribacillus frigoritolerans]USK67595.1 MerR family transcriptional regulator [Peribacillus frigoritolerans]